jgi:hypothetical protein
MSIERGLSTVNLFKNALLSKKYYVLLGFCWALALFAKFKFNGLIFGFDYGLYLPDGASYTFRTFQFLGYSDSFSASAVANWYQDNSFKFNDFPPKDLLPNFDPNWGLIWPRILYPILSVPFVKFFGIPGMLVVPSVSLLFLVYFIYFISLKVAPVWFSLVLAFSPLASTTLTRWAFSNTSDALSFVFFSLFICLLYSKIRPNKFLFLLSLLIVLSSLNRFVLPIWFSIGFFFFISRKIKFALTVLLIASLSAIPALIAAPSRAFFPRSQDLGFAQAVYSVALTSIQLLFVEIGELFVLDKVLFVFFVAAVILVVKRFRFQSSQLFILVGFSVWAIGAINGTLGVNLRYQLPLIPFLYLVIVDSLHKSSKSLIDFDR